MSNIEDINKIIDELYSLKGEIDIDRAELMSKISAYETKKLDLISKTINSLFELLTPIQVLTSIEISPTSASIKENETLQMKAVCKDQNGVIIECPKLSWDSSNTSVATIDSNGIVRAVASSGYTDITATFS